MALVGLAIQHDANHGGVSPKVNDSRTDYRALFDECRALLT